MKTARVQDAKLYPTFKNDNAKGNIEDLAWDSLESTVEDLNRFMNAEDEGTTTEFYEYGLAFDPVYPDEEDNEDREHYYRYQLSWGGPSDEIRFHQNGMIEYVYMDWFCGIGLDVSDVECMQWVKQWFEDCGVIDWEKYNEELYSFDY